MGSLFNCSDNHIPIECGSTARGYSYCRQYKQAVLTLKDIGVISEINTILLHLSFLGLWIHLGLYLHKK